MKRRWSDRVKDADVILFPGYLFCRFSAVDKLRVMISPSVRGIVSTGRNPIAVDDSEVSSVRALIATGRPIDVCPFLRIGQHVRIQQGPFASVRGVIIRAQDNWRVVVSVAALGCSASIEVDADLIEPIAPVPERKPPTPVAPKRVTYGHYQA